MRRRLSSSVLLAVIALASVLPAAGADHGGVEPVPVCYQTQTDEAGNPSGPEFCTQQVWFHRAETPVGNLAGFGAGSNPTFDTTAPAASVAGGAGGGYAANGTPRQLNGESNTQVAPRFEGTFTGNLDNLAVTLFLFAPAKQMGSTFSTSGDLVVDGVEVGRFDQVEVPLTAGGQAARKIDFVLTGVSQAMADLGVATGPDVEHKVELFVSPYPLATTTAAFVYDTTEVPSGMTFNVPGDLAGRTAIALF
jgi:hypothetical protein